MNGGQQVGDANVGGQTRASLWSGTAASWVDLSAFLPANYSSSTAQSIWSDASFIYVVGHGFNNLTIRDEALLWTQPIPEPGTASGLIGLGVLFVLKRHRRKL